MKVRVEVVLNRKPCRRDEQEMRSAAESLTDDPGSIHITRGGDSPNSIVAEFTMEAAAQDKVVDQIGERFEFEVSNYNESIISFRGR